MTLAWKSVSMRGMKEGVRIAVARCWAHGWFSVRVLVLLWGSEDIGLHLCWFFDLFH